jgi:hypothetical protein
MAYNIVRSDGVPLVTINDGQTNNTATSLTLVGKNFAGYGTFLNENLVHMLDHFASPNEPAYPLTGQLWYKKGSNLLQVYNGNTWKSISGAQNLADEPVYKVAGDLWFDSVNQQLKVYTGTTWLIIGPSFTSTTGTSGAVADTITDSSAFQHVVVKFFVQNQLVAVLSKDDAFTPGTPIPGFSIINPGMNLASGRSPDLLYYNTANNAVHLGGFAASEYLTKTNAVVTQPVIINNTQGLYVYENDGTVADFQISVSTNNVNLSGLVRGNGLKIQTKPDNAGGALLDVVTIDKVTGLVSVLGEPTNDTGVATKSYVDNRDNVTRNYLKANVDLIYSNIATTLANIDTIYGNVRTIQYDLGFSQTTSVPASSGINVNKSHRDAYVAVSSGTSISGNLLTLWANVAAIHANILSNTGTAGASITGYPSMYSNVAYLQTTLASVQQNYLQRGGGSTITGVLVPDGPNTRDLGSTVARFANIYMQSGNVDMLYNVTSINKVPQGGLVQGSQPLVIYANPLRITGNIEFGNYADLTANTNLGFTRTLNVEAAAGQLVAISTRGNITTKGDKAHDIGASGNRWNTIYVDTVQATTIVGALSSSGASTLGSTTFSGDVIPSANKTYNLGNPTTPSPGRRWNAVYAETFNSDSYISLTSTGITTGAVVDIGTSANKFRDIYGRYFVGDKVSLTATGVVTSDGTQTVGTSGTPFTAMYATTFYGRATTAQYADLAERFAADAAYAPGTIVTIGGTAEITQENAELSEDVLGVISTDPAYLMNSIAGEDATHPPVALNGRVPVRVIGPVRKGQKLVAAGNGCARGAAAGEATAHNVIGRALADKDTAGEGLVEAIVRTNV